MYAKLNASGTEVIVLMTKAVDVDTVNLKGRQRKVYTNTTEEVTRWKMTDGPTNYDIGVMGEDAERIVAWAREQDEAIQKAYANLMRSFLAGGSPVIAGTKTWKDIKDKDYEGFKSDAKTGEFCGVITGSRSIAGLMPNLMAAPAPIEEQQEGLLMTPAMVADQLGQLAVGLIEGMETRVQGGGSITDEEAQEIYEAERQIYYTLTRGLGIKARELEAAKRKSADRRFGSLKKGRTGSVLRQAAYNRQQ